MSKNILLLGSNGYLGSKINSQLINSYSVYELNREEIEGLDFDQGELFFKGLTFHIFINTIVKYQETNSIPDIIKSNYLLSFEILNKIKKSKDFKIFHFDSFYSKFQKSNTNSSYLLSKQNLLDWSKIYQKKEKEVTTFVLRLEHVIGFKESDKKFNGWLIKKLKNNQSVTLGPCIHSFDFIHIDDVVKAVILLIETLKFKNKFNYMEVGSGKSYQLKTFIQKLKLKLNSKSKVTFNKNTHTDLYKNQSSIANSKELLDLGWNPKSDLDEIIDLIL